LWHAPSTQAKDRKRILQLLIKDITVEKRAEPKQAVLHIRWQGGACTDLNVDLPPRRAEQVRCPEPVVARVRELALSLQDVQIAAQLNQDGHVTPIGKRYTVDGIRWIRWKHRVPAVQLKTTADELTVKQVAKRFGISTHVVYYWLGRGILTARQLRHNAPHWITLSAEKTRELRARVKSSTKVQRSKRS
jgi:hypothetical protein